VGLTQFEKDSIPKDFQQQDCYQSILEYIKHYIPDWEVAIKEARKDGTTSTSRLDGADFNVRLAKALPEAGESSTADQDYVMGQVIYGKFEDFYLDIDNRGTKIGAYAHRYFELRCGQDSPNDEVRNSMSTSVLYEKFGMHHEKLTEK